MHGLSESTDLTLLERKRLEQVRIGEYQLELCLSEGICISIESAVTYMGERREDLQSAGKELVDILGCEVAVAKRQGRGDLELVFSNGRSVLIHDSNEEFESYTVAGPGINFVV